MAEKANQNNNGPEGTDSTDGENTPKPTPPAGSDERSTDPADYDFPKETPLSEMTEAQKVEYWRHKARMNERRVRDRSDYDEIKAELDELKQERMTDAERAVDEARKEGEQTATQKMSSKVAEAALRGALAGRGFQPEQVDDKLSYVDFTKFVTDNGEVDTETVQRYLDDISPQNDNNGTWPDIGQGNRGDSHNKRPGGSVEAGRAIRRERQKQRTS